jgi:dTDP-glucose 4,6-dehydratase
MQALRGEPLTVYGDGSQTRSFCYCSDLIDGILRLAKSDEHDPVNIGNPDEWTILECAKEIQTLVGVSSEIVFKPLPEDDPMRRRPDITRAQTLLGWSPKVSLREGLELSMDYFTACVEREKARA